MMGDPLDCRALFSTPASGCLQDSPWAVLQVFPVTQSWAAQVSGARNCLTCGTTRDGDARYNLRIGV